MTRFAFAAAGTGGHVYPALAVADRLVAAGVDRKEIVFFGGERMEASAVPDAGFEFVGAPLRGLQRSLAWGNLALPVVIARAARRFRTELSRRGVAAMLAMGGYVTVPAGWAAHRSGTALFLHEQNVRPGLANRIAARWARQAFLAFPMTADALPGDVVGTPLTRPLAEFDRDELRAAARARYHLPDGIPVLGVLGGSQGARALNKAVTGLMQAATVPFAVVHLTGTALASEVSAEPALPGAVWQAVPYEHDMQFFYAAADLVGCRGGATTVSELLATGTPAVVVPRRATDQRANAAVLSDLGAGVLLDEAELDRLGDVVTALLVEDPSRLAAMADAARGVGRRDAATRIAAALLEAAR